MPFGGYLSLPDDLVPIEVKEVYRHIIDNWTFEGKIDVPQSTDYDLVSYYMVIFDQEGEPLFPMSKMVMKHIDEAPQASDAEIALYNRIYTPYSYDCVEDY